MVGEKNKTARAVAIDVLNQCNPRKDYAAPILNKLLNKTEQRQRATDLVYGTIRNRIAIDKVIESFSGRLTKRIPNKILNILRLGVYELVYSPDTQEYAIVNEAVENAKALTGKKQGGFVNAVLRQVARHIFNRQVELSKAGVKRSLVQTFAACCEFDTDFLPDREKQPDEYLSVVFSLPKWLVTNWLSEFGEESTRQICLASNRRPSIYLRPNALKTTAEELSEKLQEEGVDCEVVEGAMIRLKSPKAVGELPGFDEGLFVVQDIMASQPVKILNPQPNLRMLDLCAAPGTKTMQLAEATGDSATIIATDIDGKRLEMVKENAARLGIKSIRIVAYDNIRSVATETSLFDAVLLDVPCSNTGVLAKRIEARYRIKPQAIKELTKTQGELLDTAAVMLKPHGKICYSTCSIQRQENSELVRDFLQSNPDFELEFEQLILPSAEAPDRDGAYTSILCR
jgi:16S rRNA (cytosine967-C5)-methyltransferase